MPYTSEEIWTTLTSVVTELLQQRGEESVALDPTQKISADLGISSVEAIHMMIMLEDRVAMPLSFNDLAVRDGEYVDDLTLGEVAAFVGKSLAQGDGATLRSQ